MYLEFWPLWWLGGRDETRWKSNKSEKLTDKIAFSLLLSRSQSAPAWKYSFPDFGELFFSFVKSIFSDSFIFIEETWLL